MKSKFAAIAALTLVPLAGQAASTTHTVNVSATVNGSCRFENSGPTALSFGTLDQSVATNATASTGNIAFRCTTGVNSSVTKASPNDSAPNAHRLVDGANSIPYTATLNNAVQTGSGHGAGGTKNMTVSGTILNADYVDAPAGSYADTLTLTITP
jgi:spore coat protein U-like protein